MTNNDFIIKSPQTASAVLDTIAGYMPIGPKKAALHAVRSWIIKNIPPSIDSETEKRILEAFEQCRLESEMILPEIIEPATEYVEDRDE